MLATMSIHRPPATQLVFAQGPMQTYKVKTGDTLISIARQWMGTGDAWRLIAQLNGLGDPSQLKVGQTLKIPVTEYIVKSGDSLRRIAQQELGTEAAWQNIAVLNHITDPRFLVIGQILRLPVPITTGNVTHGPVTNGAVTNASASNSNAPIPTHHAPESTNSNERNYTVQRGDSLITIAQKTLGDRGRWREIALRNSISNPADLRVGTLLKLPPLKGSSPAPSSTVPATQPPANPTASPETTAQPPQSWNYTVVRGDTLIGIARKTLGNGNRWQDIAELNNLVSPSDLRVGLVLRIPGSQQSSAPSQPTQPTPATPAPAQPAPSKPETVSPSQTTRSYQVQRGDTLIKIAQKTLGNGDRWREIALLNNIVDTRDLQVGMTLKIPADSNQPTPAQPAPSPPATPTPSQPQYDNYQVQRGDTLIKIARNTLGNGNRWQDIAKLNNIVDTRDLRVGMALKVPRPNNIAPAVTPPPETPVSPAPQPPTTVPAQYTVQRGDTLIGIARKTLGDGNRWQEIASLNNINRPSDLLVGMVLKLPAQAGSIPLPAPPVVTPIPTPVTPPAGSTEPESEQLPNGPSTYTVQPGDSLFSIAEKRLGDRARWGEIGRLNNLPDPSNLRVGTVLLLPGPDGDSGPQPIAPVLSEDQDKANRKLQPVKFTTRQDNVFAQWLKSEAQGTGDQNEREERVGVLFQKGLYRRGDAKPRDFIRLASSLLRRLHLSDSEMNAIAAISDNEGYLDAVNTWDSQYLSFGLFQWTAGSVERPGELGALLTRIKQTYPDEFQHYFGQFGLDVEESDGVRGSISLNGVRLNSEYQKSILRQSIWAYRFAIAGQDLAVKSTEILHAVDRIDRFYFIRHSGLDGYSLADLIQSEFGVTLLLDNHVNRPAYVVPGLAEAIKQLNSSPATLANGSTETELRVLERYLQVRQTFGSNPMTHAKTRGDRISRQVREGYLSQERGSFVSNKQQRVG